LLAHRVEVFKVDLAIALLVAEHNGLVDNLLELFILEVVPHEQLEYSEQFTVGYQTILIHVVDLECNCTAAAQEKKMQKFLAKT